MTPTDINTVIETAFPLAVETIAAILSKYLSNDDLKFLEGDHEVSYIDFACFMPLRTAIEIVIVI